jgi:hypothetical protein
MLLENITRDPIKRRNVNIALAPPEKVASVKKKGTLLNKLM